MICVIISGYQTRNKQHEKLFIMLERCKFMGNQNEKPLVSVIMPTYNHERFISEAINSVFIQSYPNWELIIIDDGSTDRTQEMIQKMMNPVNSNRVKLIKQEHKGATQLSAMYNTALGHAQGELIAILEGDDLWPLSKLEVQVSDFSDQDIGLSFGDYSWIDPRGKIIRTICLSQYLPNEACSNDPIGTAAWYMAGLAYRTFTFPCTVVMRRSALEVVGGFQGISGPVNLIDFPTFLELSTKTRFAYHDTVLGYWRRHFRSLTTVFDENITQSTFEYSLRFLASHPEYQYGGMDLVHSSWRRIFSRVRFTEAQANLVAGEWKNALDLFKKLILDNKTQVALRGASVLGLLAAALHTNMEPLMKFVRGYDLRRMKE